MSATVTYKGSTLTTATNQTRVLETAGTYLEDDITIVDVTAAAPTLQTITKSYTPTESQQTETITAGSGYDGIEEVDVTVGAISSSYVGSGITRRDSTDLTASGATVSVPSGYYAANASKVVASGSVTSLTATKGNLSHGEILVYPHLSVSGGYIDTIADQAGDAVIMDVYDFVSGNMDTITTNGTHSVAMLESVDVAVQPTLQAKTNISPTTSSQTIQADNGYDGLSSVQINAMPSGTAGTPTATKGTVSNHSISVTPSVTNTAGYISGGTKTGTAVSVSASELVSGTYTVDSSGTKDVTNYASASIPAGTAGTPSASKGTVSNHSVSVTPSVTNTTGWITGSTKTGTAVTVSASELVSGNLPITQNGTNIDVANYSTVSVDVQGGGGSSVHIGTKYNDDNVIQSSITFYDLEGEPTSFIIYAGNDLSTSSPANVAAVVFDGTSMHGQTVSTTSNANAYYDTGFTKSYSNGTLIVTATTARFAAVDYYLIYSYGGTAGCIDTKDVQVGSGATSITFTSLEDEPAYWSCVFKSNFSTSSGYQRVIAVANDGTNTCGLEMDSSAKYSSSHWTASYSNGSLTITSQGTNAGGYFHQPGYYQLTYAYDDGSSGNYQSKTVTPTTSQQVVQADSGYDALKKVTVNPIPSSYVQPTSTVGSTTYRASTSNQTIQSGTYHSAAATIAAVSQTNLSAENIKSGTTISISNGQSNLWSVTGTYTGGGGGSVNIATATMTNSSNQNTTISFTLPSGRTPIAFFARLTSQIARSSNSRYYYVFDMRWDGSSTGGVAGNTFYMSSGTLTNVTSGYSYSQSGTTFTLSSTGSRSASPGSFYNGTYELVYIY